MLIAKVHANQPICDPKQSKFKRFVCCCRKTLLFCALFGVAGEDESDHSYFIVAVIRNVGPK